MVTINLDLTEYQEILARLDALEEKVFEFEDESETEEEQKEGETNFVQNEEEELF